MTFYFAMINAWSLAWEALYGDMDKEYPIIDTSVGAGNTAFEDDGLDYEIDLINGGSADYMAEIDDQYSHHYPGQCRRSESEKFIRENSSFINY